jgi:large subunit ribosomal protein L15
MKGQRARGSIKPLMQGGQSSLARRLPKWGFKNPFKEPTEDLTFRRLYYFIDRGLINPTQTITMNVLFEAGVFSQIKHGVKIIATGAERIDQPLHFEVTDATKAAVEAVKAKGGSVTCVYRTSIQQRYHLKPYKYDLPMRDMAMPPPNKLLKLEQLRDKGVELKYVAPNWFKDYVPPEHPEIPQAPKLQKKKITRFFNYGV